MFYVGVFVPWFGVRAVSRLEFVMRCFAVQQEHSLHFATQNPTRLGQSALELHLIEVLLELPVEMNTGVHEIVLRSLQAFFIKKKGTRIF